MSTVYEKSNVLNSSKTVSFRPVKKRIVKTNRTHYADSKQTYFKNKPVQGMMKSLEGDDELNRKPSLTNFEEVEEYP